MFRLLRRLLSFFWRAYTWLALAGLLLLGYFGYLHFQPDVQTSVQPSARSVIGEAQRKVVASLPNPPTPQTILVLPVEGDRADDYFRSQLAQEILESGKYQTVEKTFTEKVLAMANLKWGDPGDISVEEAQSAARRANAEAVLVGRLNRFRTAEPAEVELEWAAYEASEGGRMLASGELAIAGDTTTAEAGGEGISVLGGGWENTGWALLIWVGTVLLLPLFLGGVLINFLHRESNLANLGLLLALTLFDILLAIALMGFAVQGILPSLIVIAAGVAGGAYNYLLLDKLENLRVQA